MILKHIALLKQKIIALKNWFFALSWKKKIFFVVLLFAVIFLATAPLRVKKPVYETATVTRGAVSDIVSESGNVQAAAEFNVYSPTTGYIEDLYVKNGDTVSYGQNLFKVKSTATQQQKADATATLLQAQSTLGTANAAMFSLQSAKDSAWNTYYTVATNSTYQNSDGSPNTSNRALPAFTTLQNNWLAAEAQFKNQQTVVNQAKAALGSASLAYSATQDAVVTAPAAGTIANVSSQVGEKVNVNDKTAVNNKPELVVGDFTHNIISIDLNEVDVDKVHPGQSVQLVFDAQRDKTYKGHVISVALVGDNNVGVITYNTRISIDNEDQNIRPGMTVTASINTDKHENVLTVPNNAIKPYQGTKAVLVPGPGKDKVNGKTLPFHYVVVTTGIKGITRTEIISGVTDGEKVVTNTGTLLQTGQ